MPPSPSSPPPLPNSPPTTKRAYVQGRQLIVNNKPFLVKGICYSPVPINASVYWDPLGDYFTEEYSYIWLRDLPLMKAMGANVVRIYGWDSDKDPWGSQKDPLGLRKGSPGSTGLEKGSEKLP